MTRDVRERSGSREGGVAKLEPPRLRSRRDGPGDEGDANGAGGSQLGRGETSCASVRPAGECVVSSRAGQMPTWQNRVCNHKITRYSIRVNFRDWVNGMQLT
ncbi:hypothetical protein GCM10027521_44830 [Amycolatopsis cihanbeyliensis]